MRQQEAEQEAARRNVEDERRDRFVFYALDHSAGLGDDAWEVEMRLRTTEDGPVPEAVPVAAAGLAEPVTALEPPSLVEPPEPAEPSEPREPLEPTEPLALDAWEVEADRPAAAPRRSRGRPRLLHVWAAFVILVGLAFV